MKNQRISHILLERFHASELQKSESELFWLFSWFQIIPKDKTSEKIHMFISFQSMIVIKNHNHILLKFDMCHQSTKIFQSNARQLYSIVYHIKSFGKFRELNGAIWMVYLHISNLPIKNPALSTSNSFHKVINFSITFIHSNDDCSNFISIHLTLSIYFIIVFTRSFFLFFVGAYFSYFMTFLSTHSNNYFLFPINFFFRFFYYFHFHGEL